VRYLYHEALKIRSPLFGFHAKIPHKNQLVTRAGKTKLPDTITVSEFLFFPKIKKLFYYFNFIYLEVIYEKVFPLLLVFFSDCKFCFIILLENKFDWSKVFVMNRGNFSMESHVFGGKFGTLNLHYETQKTP
jgi:hypothetical protein